MTAIRVITIAALLQLATTVPTVSRGSVEGTVIRAGSGEPIEDIRVVLIPIAIPESLDASQRVVSPLTTTDAQGRFVLKDVEPGQYRLTFRQRLCASGVQPACVPWIRHPDQRRQWTVC